MTGQSPPFFIRFFDTKGDVAHRDHNGYDGRIWIRRENG
jgi:hypothetical protein